MSYLEQLNGYKIIESEDCEQCHLYMKPECRLAICNELDRKDRHNVIFVKNSVQQLNKELFINTFIEQNNLPYKFYEPLSEFFDTVSSS